MSRREFIAGGWWRAGSRVCQHGARSSRGSEVRRRDWSHHHPQASTKGADLDGQRLQNDNQIHIYVFAFCATVAHLQQTRSSNSSKTKERV